MAADPLIPIDLHSRDLRATISPHGAEVRSLSFRGVEYLWPAEEPWKRTAPLLFPIVGRLRDDTVAHKGRLYTMAQHGFARDKTFEIEKVTENSASFRLVADQATREQYPFEFALQASYEIRADKLRAKFLIINNGTESLPASFGAHPAFRWPLRPGLDKSTYVLRFEKAEGPSIHRLDNGLVQQKVYTSPIKDGVLSLGESLFTQDAIILLGLNSSSVEYAGPEGASVRLAWSGFPDLGVWSKNPGNFICIEPWHGYADPEGFSGDFVTKPGLMHIEPGGTREFRSEMRLSERGSPAAF